MTSKYHTRYEYERLLQRLGFVNSVRIKDLSGFALLVHINQRLIESNCIPFTLEELEMELH